MTGEKSIRYFIFIQIIVLQGIILWILFHKALEIDGDIGVYLNMINGSRDMDNVEPAAILIFKIIGFFPVYSHFIILFGVIFLLSILESWIIFVRNQGSIIWLIFFSLAIVPFFHAINLRTGFGMFVLFLTYQHSISLILTPFFHTSFIPLILGFPLKLSFKQILLFGGISIVIGVTFFVLVSDKLNTYFGYYSPDNGIFGVTIEIFLILIFSLILRKRYILQSRIFWYRILFSIIFLSIASVKIAIISSRFVTLSYLIILITVMSSQRREHSENFSLLDILFYISFISLILFRIYRIVTMFGFV